MGGSDDHFRTGFEGCEDNWEDEPVRGGVDLPRRESPDACAPKRRREPHVECKHHAQVRRPADRTRECGHDYRYLQPRHGWQQADWFRLYSALTGSAKLFSSQREGPEEDGRE